MILFHGILGCFALLSTLQALSQSRLKKNERRLLEYVRTALRKTAVCSISSRVTGTERGCFSKTRKSAEGACPTQLSEEDVETLGLQQLSQVQGRYQRAENGDGYDFHLEKNTQIVVGSEEAVVLKTETLARDKKCMMRVNSAPWGCSQLFPKGWFPLKEHKIGKLVNARSLAGDFDLFDENMLEEDCVLGVLEAPLEVIQGTHVRCVRVSVCPSSAKQQDARGRSKHNLVAYTGNDGFLDALHNEVEAWTEYLVSEVEGIIIGVRSRMKSSSVSSESGEWECNVEATRDLTVTSEDQRSELPNPLSDPLVSVVT